jgi:hypothetical protein
MPFEVGLDGPHFLELRPIERARFGPGRIQDRRGMPLRQHEAIRFRMFGMMRVEAQLSEEQRRDDFRRRAARAGMATGRRGRRDDRIDAELGGNVVERGGFRRTFG